MTSTFNPDQRQTLLILAGFLLVLVLLVASQFANSIDARNEQFRLCVAAGNDWRDGDCVGR